MKQIIAIATCCAVLSACGTFRGLTETTPKLSSRTNKDIPTYLECVRAKWAETAQVSTSNKKESGELSGSDKSGASELINVSADGTGAHVMMYESQDSKKEYNSAYRDAAVSCL